MHLHPSEGTARDVGEAIVAQLYPPGAPSRIPIVSVTGTNGKTTVTRLVGHVLRATGLTVGMTTTGGVWIGDDRVARGDTTGPGSARAVLSDTAVEVERGERFTVVGRGTAIVFDGRVTHSGAAEAADDEPVALFDVGLHVLAPGCGLDLGTRRPFPPPDAQRPAQEG